MVIEVGIKTIPSVLFIILATIRFFQIKDIGFASRNTNYSSFFIAKVVISAFLSGMFLLLIIIIISL